MFGQSIEVLGLEIAFHKQANLYGTHGVLVASHRDQKLANHPVRFVFVGLSEAPPLTPIIMNYIWEEARAQGYVPLKLMSYGHILETHSDPKIVPKVGSVPEAILAIAEREAHAVMSRAQSHEAAPGLQAELDDMATGIALHDNAKPAVWRGAGKTEPRLANVTTS
jgi:hypothetical protein